jgi:Rod binding domain-containing protein
MNVLPLFGQGPRTSSAEDARDPSTFKAGAQFEAVLLNKVFGDMQQAFTALPGDGESHATQAYSGLAMQALTTQVAEAGGIGIGRVLSKTLEKQSGSHKISGENVKDF